jgi:hypothetical protein
MAYNPPFEYQITPETVEPGTRWLSVHLENTERQPLMNLDVRLISSDSLRIRSLDRGGYINMLNPGEEDVVPMQVEVNQGTWVYLHVEYWVEGELFYWESPNVWISAERDPARMMTLFSMGGPEVLVGTETPVEATLVANMPTDPLRVDFWVETAGGAFEAFDSADIAAMKEGEIRTVTTQFEPDDEGLYSVYAYLFEGDRRLDRKIEQIRVVDAS